jgi:hypothetical protein
LFAVWAILAILVCIFIILAAFFRGCSQINEVQPEPVIIELEAPFFAETKVEVIERYTDLEATVVIRMYLDGIQAVVNSEYPRALVGLKYINGQTVEGYQIKTTIWEDAKKVISQDWPLEHCPELTQPKRVAVKLAEMRMGPTGFKNSTLFQKLQDKKFDEAGDYFLLEYNGKPRRMGMEAKQYLYILRLLWEEEISIEDLESFPSFSYRRLPLEKLNGFDEETLWILKRSW